MLIKIKADPNIYSIRRSPTRHGHVSFAGSVATAIYRSQGRAGFRII